MPFNIALSGLNAASNDLKVTGNNIANSGTTGFKESRAEFADIYATSITGVSSNAIGGGVRLSRVAQQFDQGNIAFTNNSLDLAINGEGFMVVERDGARAYTRAGAFGVDRDGFVETATGHRLQVYPPVGNSQTEFNTGNLTDLRVQLSDASPQATSSVELIANLDAAATPLPVAGFDPLDPESFNFSTSYTVFDSLGAEHTATSYFVRDDAAANTWASFLYIDDGSGSQVPVTQGGNPAANLVFNPDGSLDTANSDGVDGQITFDTLPLVNGAADLNITLDADQFTQFGGGSGVNALTQDGFTTGRLTGIDVADTGEVLARFTNGQSRALGKLALATFANKQGLQQLGDTMWAETFSSGEVLIGEAGSASLGLLQSGALESSNVDIAAQLVNLITAQRNFQANAQVITTADTVTQTIINIR